MKNNVLVVIMSVLLLACSERSFDSAKEIADVKLPQRIQLDLDEGRYTHTVRIKLAGNLDNSAEIKLVGEEGVEYTGSLSAGAVNEAINREWYSKTCFFEYLPHEVTSGTLTIQYEFKYADD
jgi:hypothetical protein